MSTIAANRFRRSPPTRHSSPGGVRWARSRSQASSPLPEAAFSLRRAVVPWLFFTPVIYGGAPLAGCTAACPANALLIADRPTIAAPFGSDMSYGTIAISSATLACLLYRLASATRPRRRALLPVYIPAVMLTVPALIFHGAVTRHLDLDPTTI